MLMFLLIYGDHFLLAACQMLVQFTGFLSLVWATKISRSLCFDTYLLLIYCYFMLVDTNNWLVGGCGKTDLLFYELTNRSNGQKAVQSCREGVDPQCEQLFHNKGGHFNQC